MLNHSAAAQTVDDIGMFDRGKPMRDDNGGTPAAQFFHGFLHERFGLVVQR